MILPADTHVHSEWSWDTRTGAMEQTCERAIKVGLPALAFTDHLDLTGWKVETSDITEGLEHFTAYLTPDGRLTPPPLDIEGYLECVDRCRHKYPDLRILTGVEFGQPHRDGEAAAKLLDVSRLDRVNGSLHMLQVGEQFFEPLGLYRLWPADKVIWEYLAEVPRMMQGSDAFSVFTHIDYAVRYWPTATAGLFDPKQFEDGFRQAMRAVAGSGRALEMNVGGQLRPWIPQWWSEEGGEAITFGSDAHAPMVLGNNFPEAVAMVEHYGFRPGRQPTDFWTR